MTIEKQQNQDTAGFEMPQQLTPALNSLVFAPSQSLHLHLKDQNLLQIT